MNCEKVRSEDLVARYVAGGLSGEDMDAFEQHYFGCEECLSAVQIGQAIREGASSKNDGAVLPARDASSNVITMPARTAAPAASTGANGRRRPRWMVPVAAAAAIFVGGLVVWRFASVQPGPKTEIAKDSQGALAPAPAPTQVPAPAPEPTSAPTSSEPVLLASNLSAVDPLPYRASVLRGTTAEDGAERFRNAMQSYVAKDYSTTAAKLLAIPVGVPGAGSPDQHVTDAGIKLYLGISQLMLGHDSDGVHSLERSTAYGDTPYLENARFYLAKGLIRLKQYPAAAAQLREAVALNGDRRADAEQLLKQLNRLTAQ